MPYVGIRLAQHITRRLPRQHTKLCSHKTEGMKNHHHCSHDNRMTMAPSPAITTGQNPPPIIWEHRGSAGGAAICCARSNNGVVHSSHWSRFGWTATCDTTISWIRRHCNWHMHPPQWPPHVLNQDRRLHSANVPTAGSRYNSSWDRRACAFASLSAIAAINLQNYDDAALCMPGGRDGRGNPYNNKKGSYAKSFRAKQAEKRGAAKGGTVGANEIHAKLDPNDKSDQAFKMVSAKYLQFAISIYTSPQNLISPSTIRYSIRYSIMAIRLQKHFM